MENLPLILTGMITVIIAMLVVIGNDTMKIRRARARLNARAFHEVG